MRPMRPSAWPLLLASVTGLACAGAPAGTASREKRMDGLRFGTDVEGRQASDEAAQAAAAPVGLAVGEPTVHVSARRIAAELPVVNTTAAPIEAAVMPYGGRSPYGGDSPFLLAFADEAHKTVTYTGELYPPVPPPPMLIVFPPGRTVVFDAEIPLDDWSWRGAPVVPVRWSFHGYAGPLGEGEVRVELPKRR